MDQVIGICPVTVMLLVQTPALSILVTVSPPHTHIRTQPGAWRYLCTSFSELQGICSVAYHQCFNACDWVIDLMYVLLSAVL